MPFLLDLYFPTRAQNQDFDPGLSDWLDLIKFRAEPIGQEQSPDLIKFRDFGQAKIYKLNGNYMEKICHNIERKSGRKEKKQKYLKRP